MEKSSFFNSVSHDRTYKAEDWAEYFATERSVELYDLLVEAKREIRRLEAEKSSR